MPDTFYPPVGFHFSVHFEGLPSIGDFDVRFQEVSGLSAELAVEELQEGGENRFIHKMPGKTKFPNLVLKRGMYVPSALSDWARKAIDNLEISPVNIQVLLLNENHNPLAAWNLHNAYPVKIQVSDFKAQDNSIVIETLELAFQYSVRMKLA